MIYSKSLQFISIHKPRLIYSSLLDMKIRFSIVIKNFADPPLFRYEFEASLFAFKLREEQLSLFAFPRLRRIHILFPLFQLNFLISEVLVSMPNLLRDVKILYFKLSKDQLVLLRLQRHCVQ